MVPHSPFKQLSDVAAGGVPGTREEPRNTGESNAASQLGVRVDVRPSREPLLVMSSQLVHRSEERTVSHSPPGLSNSQGLGFVSPGASSRTFEPLIQVIREGYGQSTGTPKILRSQAAKGLKRGYPELYKDPNIGSFKQYVKQAEVAGVTEGFKDSKNSLWIQLKLEPDGISWCGYHLQGVLRWKLALVG